MKKQLNVTVVLVSVFLINCGNETDKPAISKYEWQFSTPEEQGMDDQILDSAFIQADFLEFVDGLIVIRNGEIIAEDYYNGYDENTPHNVKSVSKSFLSAITGIALYQGLIDSLGEKVLDYFPEYIYEQMDERKYDITIRHLLTMQMGIDREANNDYELYNQIYYSDDWLKSTIELPLLSDPGASMRYNTFQTHLLSAVIDKSTDKNLLEYATDNLFNPMGIDIEIWEQGPKGYYFGGNSMYFTPREMAVLGYLFLNDGKLNNQQIIQSEWVDLSLTKTWDEDNPEWGVLTDYNYGYLWWLGKINGYDLFMALGYGGQLLVAFPTINLIVVSTADHNIPPDVSQTQPILKIISDYILPAVN